MRPPGPRVRTAVSVLRQRTGRVPKIRVVVGDLADFPNKRDFAMASLVPWRRVFVITVSPRLEDQPLKRVLGILAHEFGHVLLAHGGHTNHSEVEADRVGSGLLAVGHAISYDSDDVQTVTHRKPRRRPGHLHQ